ncbi:MAG: excinuclease ABC subunit UvrA [Acidobacteriota bacterium]|nr:excinuclease ABC subunit UvrA [Acidobacteriota bacterium]MDQ7088118.1 excinuclease ABC subunit UvrA [Acidobacteriota bacterium]
MESYIHVRGAAEHNLKKIDVRIPRHRLVVVTGVSGSGKSSLAFDTIYAEGQRRYVESLSAYARQFLEMMQKPEVESIEGLSPAISIEQKTTSRNPRSTVGTVTEIYDYLRLLFARIGRPHCPHCGKEITRRTVQQIVDAVLELPEESRVQVLAPVVRSRKGHYRRDLEGWARQGFVRARVDGKIIDLDQPPDLDRKKVHDIDIIVDRLVLRDDIRGRLTDSVETALKLGEGLVRVLVGPDAEERLYSEHYSCPEHGVSIPEMSPRAFSFNSPYGACPACSGLGVDREFDPEKIVVDPDAPVVRGAIELWSGQDSYLGEMVAVVLRAHRVPVNTKWKDLPRRVQRIVMYGSGKEEYDFVFRSDRSRYAVRRPFEGVIPRLLRRLKETSSESVREDLERYMSSSPCSECDGARLRPEVLAVTVGAKNIAEATAMTVEQAGRHFRSLRLTRRERQIARLILKEIRERLGFLENVGLGYLTLDRAAATLSGGEGQRIRLATQIGSRLTGVLYVLDEPSIGLHQRDNRRLLDTLMSMRDLGNTVIVVEHDEETIRSADHVIDLGPGAGELGGEVVVAGTPEQVAACPRSLTGQYLSGKRRIETPARRQAPDGRWLTVRGARQHNLQNIDARLPVGLLTCVTGVSGSGKSTLVNQTLYPAMRRHFGMLSERPGEHDAIEGLEHFDKIVDIDQSPIGRTPRSNPATYVGLLTPIRELLAQVPEARARGYRPGRFSFNVKGGRCEACEGCGVIRIEMHFLPDVFVTCEECRGRRYNRETLEVRWKGRSIAEILELTVAQALEFFSAVPQVERRLSTLVDVGLGYLRLGQQATTLSGGEAQRVKLAKELSRRSTGRTLYLLDEPTTGLHFEDVRKLLEVLVRLRDEGNTIVVIEHNLDVIKTADWVLDLGPEGGAGGGRIVAEGTPETLAAQRESWTGRYLADHL